MLTYVRYLLSIRNLRVSVGGAEILHGISLNINHGEIHAVMGPNGSGKSTLVNTLMGHPAYAVTGGRIELNGRNLLEMKPHERARAGLFLAFQHPKEINGVTLRSFIFAALNARNGGAGSGISPLKFSRHLAAEMQNLEMDVSMAERPLNKGFSGGEKKKAEVLQLKVLKPALALLDETDSGLDVDALKIVADGINAMKSPEFSALLVTHYARILSYVVPDHVHVMIDGNIAESGGSELAKRLEKEGYAGRNGRRATGEQNDADSIL